MDWLKDLISNRFLITGVAAWFIAQVAKTIIYAIINKKWVWERIVGDGGMPSGHSATVTSLATISALTYGFNSFQFAVTMLLAIIVCTILGIVVDAGFDETGVAKFAILEPAADFGALEQVFVLTSYATE